MARRLPSELNETLSTQPVDITHRKRTFTGPTRWARWDDSGALVEDIYPPNILWAEVSFLDNSSIIENNFGIPVELTKEKLDSIGSDVDYLSAVRGLWYANLNGPLMTILRMGAQILLGLPFAEESGTIEEIRTDYSPNTGRMLVRDAQATTIVRSYTFPSELGLETNPATGVAYVVGDTVAQFAPLVQGVELLDYISDSTWMDLYANQGAGSLLHRFFRFLLRVDYGAFQLCSMLFAREFILKVKPHYVYPFFSVVYTADEASVDVTDDVDMRLVFSIFDTPNAGVNVAKMFDQPEDAHDSVVKVPPEGPIGSTCKNSFDVGYSARSGVADLAYDDPCPDDDLSVTMCTTTLAPGPPELDTVFAWDLPVYDPVDPETPIYWQYDVDLPAGEYCRDKEL